MLKTSETSVMHIRQVAQRETEILFWEVLLDECVKCPDGEGFDVVAVGAAIHGPLLVDCETLPAHCNQSVRLVKSKQESRQVTSLRPRPSRVLICSPM
jgi:hypothetical protein